MQEFLRRLGVRKSLVVLYKLHGSIHDSCYTDQCFNHGDIRNSAFQTVIGFAGAKTIPKICQGNQ